MLVPEAWYCLRQGTFLKPLSDLDPQQRACDVMRNDVTSLQPDLSSWPEVGTPSCTGFWLYFLKAQATEMLPALPLFPWRVISLYWHLGTVSDPSRTSRALRWTLNTELNTVKLGKSGEKRRQSVLTEGSLLL